MRALLFFVIFAIFWGFAGCAHHQADADHVVVVSSPGDKGVTGASPGTDKAAQSGPLGDTAHIIDQLIAVTEQSILVQNNLDDFDTIDISVPLAEVQVEAGLPRRQTALRISRLTGDDRCRVRIVENDTELKLTQSDEPSAPNAEASKNKQSPAKNCRFGIELRTHAASKLAIKLKHGGLMAERWDEPISVTMENGDIDVGKIGALNVTCGKCTLAGEELAGPLRYQIEAGNVGLASLGGSVEGSTSGDTILKWANSKNVSKVNVVSKAGDVYLVFPRGAPLVQDLKAARGEVDTKFNSVDRGINVTVSADFGNVRVLPAGAR